MSGVPTEGQRGMIGTVSPNALERFVIGASEATDRPRAGKGRLHVAFISLQWEVSLGKWWSPSESQE